MFKEWTKIYLTQEPPIGSHLIINKPNVHASNLFTRNSNRKWESVLNDRSYWWREIRDRIGDTLVYVVPPPDYTNWDTEFSENARIVFLIDPEPPVGTVLSNDEGTVFKSDCNNHDDPDSRFWEVMGDAKTYSWQQIVDKHTAQRMTGASVLYWGVGLT